MANRRVFIQAGAAATAAAWLGLAAGVARADLSPRLAKFVQPLRRVGAAGGIPVAQSDGTRAWPGVAAQHYSLRLEQFEDLLHPSLPHPTRLWGYRASNVAAGANRHLGGVIVAQRGVPVQLTVTNALPAQHLLPVDATIMGAERGQACNQAAIHLHGGFVPWISDGGPHTWFDPAGGYGASALLGTSNIFQLLNAGLAPGQAGYYYPNLQGARMLWFHDHALGITRLNAYAGMASAYVLTDAYEADTLVTGHGLPGPLDARTHYLVFQDKVFVGAETAQRDPEWFERLPQSRPGDLWYPHEHDPGRLKKKDVPLPLPEPSVVPEQFGDTVLVNGTVAPYLEVEQRQYRLRMLNACNSRFLNPRLVYAQGSTGVAATEPRSNSPGPAFIQIGHEGGFLPAPVMLGGPRQPELLLAPAERADLLVDFRNVPAGSMLILYNDAAAPFPNGSAADDHHPGNPRTPQSVPGSTPNTRTLLQVRVVAAQGVADPSIRLPAQGLQNPLDGPFLVAQQAGVPTAVPPGVPVRRLTLNEGFDAYGRLLQLIGTDQPVAAAQRAAAAFFGRPYDAAATEVVRQGSVEVWEILNLSADTHPMHFHLVNVQVLSRQPFNGGYTGGEPRWLGPPRAPDANELGWKETVRMNPGEATRVIVRFDLPAVPFAVPPSPRTGGSEFVWHCHILEHEEHDMMRPLVVMP